MVSFSLPLLLFTLFLGVGHTDAVLALAWNHHVEHVLASGGVDETVLLWDMSEGNVATKLTAHKEKIQAMQWHPMEAQTLLTGCCDEYVLLYVKNFLCYIFNFPLLPVDSFVSSIAGLKKASKSGKCSAKWRKFCGITSIRSLSWQPPKLATYK